MSKRWQSIARSAAARPRASDLGNLGLAYSDLGETRRAIEFYEKALEIDHEIGNRQGEGMNLWNMGLALDKLGERAQAIARAEAALKIFEQIEDPNAAKVRVQTRRVAEALAPSAARSRDLPLHPAPPAT